MGLNDLTAGWGLIKPWASGELRDGAVRWSEARQVVAVTAGLSTVDVGLSRAGSRRCLVLVEGRVESGARQPLPYEREGPHKQPRTASVQGT